MLLQEVTGLLRSRNKTIAVAESSTGGLIAKTLTDIPGSSQYFILGIVAYHNRTKTKILSIPKSIINHYGAVSAQTTSLMAQNIRKIAKTDFGIGVTGIAGPTGSSKTKPVGTAFIAIDSKDCGICIQLRLKGNRLSIRNKITVAVFKLLFQCLKK